MYTDLIHKIFAVKQINEGENLKDKLKEKPLSEIEKYEEVAEQCLAEMDNLIMLMNRTPNIQEESFKTRGIFYVLRDQLRSLKDKIIEGKNDEFYYNEIIKVITFTNKAIEEIFLRRKKLIDSVEKKKYSHKLLRRIGPLWISIPLTTILNILWIIAGSPILRLYHLLKKERK